MNILYLIDETYLHEIARAIQPCDGKTLIVIGKRVQPTLMPIVPMLNKNITSARLYR